MLLLNDIKSIINYSLILLGWQGDGVDSSIFGLFEISEFSTCLKYSIYLFASHCSTFSYVLLSSFM